MADEQTQAAAPQTSAAAAESDDSLIGDILKGDAEESGSDTESGDDAAGEQEQDQADDDHADPDTSSGEDDDSLPVEDDDAAEPGQASGDLAAARKAADEGDLDKAFKLAFGKKPEELFPNDAVWTRWRAANNKRSDAHAEKERLHAVEVQKATQWVQGQRQQISGIIEQLRPYEKYYLAEQAFQKDGDPSHLVAIITGVSGMSSYDEAQKLILTKQRRSPGERALQQQVQSLMQKLEEAERKKTEEAQQQTTQQQYQNDLGIISSTLKGEVTKVPRFAERVYQVLVKTRTPTGLSMSIEDAGRRVLAAERRKLATHPLVAKPAPKNPVSAAASTLAKAKKAKQGAAPVLRRDSRTNGTVDEKSETTDDILKDILPSGKKRATAL